MDKGAIEADDTTKQGSVAVMVGEHLDYDSASGSVTKASAKSARRRTEARGHCVGCILCRIGTLIAVVGIDVPRESIVSKDHTKLKDVTSCLV